MHPEPGQLALLADPRIGQPDRRHQVTLAQHRQHHRVDLVGLARQRGKPLHLLGVGDLDRPALLLEDVVHEPSAGHRLDDGADRLCVYLVDSSRERSQRIDVRRDGELVELFPQLVQKTDIDLASTEIQPGVQH